jgi:L-amino acid N-acyltransferase YncA
MSGMSIREMNAADAEAVLRIYQQGIDTGNASYAETAGTWQAFDSGRLKAPRLVAEQDGALLGWAALSAISSRPCYAGVAETAIYIADGAQGRGVGDALLGALVAASEAAGFWTLQSLIFTDNRASIRLHEKHGFRVLGVRERLGYMTFGPWKGWRDVAMLERRSSAAGMTDPT